VILERMDAFFDSRLDGYEEHQLTCIESAGIFYPFTASLLPMAAGCEVLDLGCGTGLELDAYFERNPDAAVTGIDLAPGMLEKLRAKFPKKRLTLIQGSYFDLPFGSGQFDAAVSVESLHHFTQEQKIPLYRKLRDSLKPGGYFILTDYMAGSEDEERLCFSEFSRLKREQGLPDGGFFHYDTPLTREHEIQTLRAGGFSRVELVRQWGNTVLLKAVR